MFNVFMEILVLNSIVMAVVMAVRLLEIGLCYGIARIMSDTIMPLKHGRDTLAFSRKISLYSLSKG